MRVALLVTAVICAAALPGCLSAPPHATADVALFGDRHVAFPGGSTGFVLYVNNTFDKTQTFSVGGVGPSWRPSFEPERVTVGPGGGAAILMTLRPRSDAALARHDLTLVLTSAEGHRTEVSVAVDLVQHAGSPAEEGKGARVYTAGFYDNGTLFYTNDRAIDENDALVKGYLGDERNFTELKVYVGGQRGTTPPEPYGSAGYVPVIKGFNDRLIGMRPGETAVVHIPPSRAYTYAGNEDHPLFGHALNFAIRVSGVDDLPPPSPLPLASS
ncbi:MAG: FKBP-type peptidyl-prolyl cis-trans isomerase [Euryarchaeota archaeon]|nr:FKBP-type peptidyl-prolyl cis-trans isomerase [Euryarchaeota archaeon]